MMIRRGSGGYYVNGIVARYPLAAISVRSTEAFARAGSTTTPDLSAADLAIRNVLVAQIQSALVFQTPVGTGTAEALTQNSFDLAGNSIVNSQATAASLFTAFPATVTGTTTEAAFDWTPAAASPALSGGMATFTGKIATKAAAASPTGNVFAGTSFVGAASAATGKWWDKWTKYYRN
jgi:hypothetical protein